MFLREYLSNELCNDITFEIATSLDVDKKQKLKSIFEILEN